VAEEMARNAREKSGADIGLATTGVAGPSGGSTEKPVGLVYIGLSNDQKTQVFEHRFSGNRETIKKRASQAALEYLRRHCLQLPYKD
jgi:nicotinamide-nucleotide amidase